MHLLKNPWKIGAGIAPAFLIYTIFCIVPIFVWFYYSFMSWNGFFSDAVCRLGQLQGDFARSCVLALFSQQHTRQFWPLYLARCRLRSCSL